MIGLTIFVILHCTLFLILSKRLEEIAVLQLNIRACSLDLVLSRVVHGKEVYKNPFHEYLEKYTSRRMFWSLHRSINSFEEELYEYIQTL